MYGHVLLIVSGLLARHVGSVLQPADTAAALGKFTYDCQPPCQLTAAFFERGPEKQIKDNFKALLGTGDHARVLDIGMNAGYFTLLAAAYGAHVTAFDPQPSCIQHALQLLHHPDNKRLARRVQLLNMAVGEPGTLLAGQGCNGSFQGQAQGRVVPVVPLNAVVTQPRRFRLVKIDTEGAEVQVLEGVLPLFQAGQVQHLVVEVVPTWWPARGADTTRGLTVLNAMAAAASQTLLLDDGTPFKFPKEKVVHEFIHGRVYSGFTMEDLVRDRQRTGAGCNLYFVGHG